MSYSTYVPRAGDTLLPNAVGVTELGTTVGGFIGACGWAALQAVRKIVNPAGVDASPAGVTALTQGAVQSGQTVGKYAASGQATPSNIKYIAGRNGLQMMDLTEDQALSVAGIDPVEIGVSNARAFGGNDSNVSGHYIAEVGRTARGDLIISDPNSAESTQGKLTTITPQQLDAARPFWFGGVEASGSGNPQAFSATPPGFPGPIWNPSVNIGQAAAGNLLGGALGGILQWIQNGLMRMGTFVVGLALLVLGLYVVFHGERVVKVIGDNTKKAGAVAALAA